MIARTPKICAATTSSMNSAVSAASTRLFVMMRCISSIDFAGASSLFCAIASAYFAAAAGKPILASVSLIQPALSVQITSQAAGNPGTQA